MALSAEQMVEELEEGNISCSNKPVDLVHLSRQTFGNKDLENEVLGLFYKHSQKCLERLKNATTPKEWAEAMHSIKGSARAIGAWKVGDLAEQFESSHPAETKDEQQAAVEDIESEVINANEFIKNLI